MADNDAHLAGSQDEFDGKPAATPGAIPATLSPKKRDGIALCLSGGGFRASLFHLGSLKRLYEIGLLQRIKTISSVSGGSILMGYLAGKMIESGKQQLQFDNWENDVATGFRSVAGRDLRTLPVLLHLLWNWAFPGLRMKHMVARYRERLTRRVLSELPKSPRFVFCATDILFGVNWEFSKERCGDYLAGYTKKVDRWCIAQAVAASASFPPVFGPMPINVRAKDLSDYKYRGVDREALCRKIALSDGGVYDNMGTEPVWKTHEQVLISDCGAPFQLTHSNNYVRRLMRYTAVVMNQAAAVRKRMFFSDTYGEDGDPRRRYQGAYWGIAGSVEKAKAKDDTIAGYSQSLVEDVIEKVRTDLDRFTLPEMHVLENHGYLLTAATIRERFPDLEGTNSSVVKPPHPDWMDEERVRQAMKESHKRLSFKRLLGFSSSPNS